MVTVNHSCLPRLHLSSRDDFFVYLFKDRIIVFGIFSSPNDIIGLLDSLPPTLGNMGQEENPGVSPLSHFLGLKSVYHLLSTFQGFLVLYFSCLMNILFGGFSL